MLLLCFRYGVLILVVELIGLSSVIPYGMLLPFQTLSSGSKGLPIDDGKVILPPEKRFRVHILVPCYKVGLGSVAGLLTAVYSATGHQHHCWLLSFPASPIWALPTILSSSPSQPVMLYLCTCRRI